MRAIQEASVDACAICFNEVDKDAKNRYTHPGENGAKHPFHKECLQGWVADHSSCPACREYIDPSSLFSRTEQVMQKLKPALTTAAYAAGSMVVAMGAGAGAVVVGPELGDLGVVGQGAMGLAGGSVLCAVIVERWNQVVQGRISERVFYPVIGGMVIGSLAFAAGMGVLWALGAEVTKPALGALVATATIAAGIASGVWSFIGG